MKQFYARTNHRAFEHQIARHEQRVARLQQIEKQLAVGQDSTATHADNDNETLPQLNFSEHYRISHLRKDHFNLTRWLADNEDDKAVEVSVLFCDNAQHMLIVPCYRDSERGLQ